ncbi:MAG: CARDB domain-containing protein, partial [Candidatus Thermoplasmatota archaeon]
PGDYYFIISAYSKSDAKISKSLKFKAKVVKEEIKIVKIETSKTIATADDNIKITVYVENRGEGIGEKIPIIIKAGDEEVYSDVIAKISPNTTQTIVATWKAKPGTYQINVKVSTESGVGATLAVEEKKVLGLTTEYWSYVILVIIAIIIIGACIGFAVRKPPKVPERPTIPMPTPEPLPPLPTVPSIPVPPPEPKIEKVKIARIKCPKCGSIKDVTSPTRPIELRCEGCNAKLLLKK